MNTTHQNPRTGPTTWGRGLLAALLVAGLTTLGSLAVAGVASADTGASFAGCPQLDEGDTGPCITQLQHKLTTVHPEYNLPADSETFGPATRIALLDFQGRNHLGADGRFGTTTARELDRQYAAATRVTDAPSPPKPDENTPKGSSLPGCPQLDIGDTGPCVAQLQNLLNKVHPEYKLPGNQTYGAKTQAAVRDFQERNNITGGNGQFGPGTAKALQDQATDVPKTVEPPVQPPVDPVDPNKECLDQGKVRDTGTGKCISDGVVAENYPGQKGPIGLGAVNKNCGNVTCSLYLSRSSTRNLHKFLEKHDWQVNLAQIPACTAIAAATGELAPATEIGCNVHFVWIMEEIQRADEDHGAKGACLKMTYTKKVGEIPPVITYWSTNNGQYCKD